MKPAHEIALLSMKCPTCGKVGKPCSSFLGIFFVQYHEERVIACMKKEMKALGKSMISPDVKSDPETVTLMYHDDDCNELLDSSGFCDACGFSPDMQSTGFTKIPKSLYESEKKAGRTFLGLGREPM